MSAEAAPLATGVTAAVVGVTDFAPHLAFFCGELGFEVASAGVVPADAAARLWGRAEDVEVRMLTAAGADTGRIHLVRVAEPVAPAGHPHTLDLGLAGLNLYTRDIEAACDRLQAAGYPWLSRPVTYQVPLAQGRVSVTEGICLGPEGVGVVFVQPAAARGTTAWRVDPERRFTELTSVAAHVPDLEAELRFWGPDGLGLTVGYDVAFRSPGLAEMADLPPDGRVRLAFITGAEGGTARVELLRIEAARRGVDRRAGQRPGRALGHTCWSVRVRELDAAVARARRAGGRVHCPPFAATTPLHGRARLALVDTPNGIAVELWRPE